MLITAIFFIIGFILITKGADIFINCTVFIGKKTNIPEIVLGATIVSFATTLPELTVSLLAALEGHTTMSLGNAVGSIICNTGLILGLVGLISPFRVNRNMFFSKVMILSISVITLIVLGMDLSIGRYDSFILIAILGLYMVNNYLSAKNDKKTNRSNKDEEQIKDTRLVNLIALFILGLVMMVCGSKLLVDNGVIMAEYIGVPQSIVSLTVIALGTSLPELVSSLTAIKKNHHSISIGNVLGANILNITSVIGLSSMANDIPILSQNIKIDFPFMILLLLVVMIPTTKTNKLSRIQGIMLLLIYIIYIGSLYFIYVG